MVIPDVKMNFQGHFQLEKEIALSQPTPPFRVGIVGAGGIARSPIVLLGVGTVLGAFNLSILLLATRAGLRIERQDKAWEPAMTSTIDS